jgi:exonuclease SbcC
MKLQKIILENFLTYEELEYSFQDKALLVQGVNLTDKNQKSNGSGKSAIQTGIEFALTSSNSRGVNDKELITYGFDSSRVQLYVRCDVRKETLHIDWTIKSKGSNKLSLSLNDKAISFSNVNDGKKQILDWLGISKEDLFNYFIINSTRFKSFFGSSNREKVDLINRFSDSSIIDGLEKIDNSQLQEDADSIEMNISKADGKVELLEEQIENEKNKDFTKELETQREGLKDELKRIDVKISNREDSIEELEVEIKEIKLSIKDKEKEVKELNESNSIELELKSQEDKVSILKGEYENLSKIVEDFKLTDYSSEIEIHEGDIDSLEDKLEKNQNSIEGIEKNISKVDVFLKGVDVKLGGSIECPKCSHDFILDGDREVLLSKKEQGDELLKKYNKELIVLNKVEEDLNSNIKSIDELIVDIEDKKSKEKLALETKEANMRGAWSTLSDEEGNLSTIKAKLLTASNISADVKESIKDLKFEIKEIELEKKGLYSKIKDLEESKDCIKDDIKNLKVSSNKETISKLKKEIGEVLKSRNGLVSNLAKVNDSIYERNKWANNFKQFRLHLANKSLETMQYRTNEFLKELGNDILVRLDGYKIKANGTIKEEISAVIIRDGERTFSSLSGGEQVRVLFSSILANRHLINQTHPYGGLDFLSVDEVFDKIDSLGMKYLIRSAKKLETCIMVISHVSDEDLSGEEILTIVKENGVSTIRK